MNKSVISIVRISAVLLLGIIIVGYSIFQAWKLISGPIITVYTPQNGATYNQTLIEIDGRAKNVAYINLDDRKIFTDKDGDFSEKILLSPGLNTVVLSATDKFGAKTEKKLELVLNEY